MRSFAPGLGLGKVYGGGKDYDQQVTVTTYPSFVQGVIRGTIRPEDYGLLLLDEVHESLTTERVKAVNAFTGAIKIGFTATPKYHDDKTVSNLLPEEIHRLRIREAVDKEMICSFSVLIAKTSIDVSSVSIVGGDYPEKELERLLNTAARNVAAVRLYKELASRGEKGAIFSCLSVRHAYDMAKLLNEAGVPAGVMEGEMSDDERKKVTKAFEDGELEVLCGKDLLIRGFDNQKVRYSFNMRPTGSPVLAEQRGGRVLRKPRQAPPGYTKHALIIEFVDGKGLKDQVLFSEVAGAAEMYPPASSEGEERGRGEGGREAFDLQIPGLEVVTDIEEVMRVTRGIKEAFEGHVAEVAEDGLYVVDGKLYGSLEQLAAGHALPFARLLSVLASLGKEPKDLATIPVKTDAGVKRLYSKEEVDGYLELVPEVLPKIRARLEDKGEVMYEGAIWATAEVFAREFGLKSPRDWYRLIDAACEAAKQTIEPIRGSEVSEILASYQSRQEPAVRRKVLRTDMVSFWPKERTLSLVRDHLAQRKSKPVLSEADKQAALERKETVERGWLVEGGKPYVGMQWLKSTELFKGQSEDVIERIMINLTQKLQSNNVLKEFIQVDPKTKFVLLSRVIWFLELRRANVFGTENQAKYAEWIDTLKAKTFEGAE